jgi:hypothetical protein
VAVLNRVRGQDEHQSRDQMTPPKAAHPKGKGYPRLIGSIILVCFIAAAAYGLKDEIRNFFTYKHRADVGVLHQAIDSVYTVLDPRRVSTSTTDPGGHRVRCDRVELSRGSSIIRANHKLTRAVEKAGGEVVLGIESSDQGRRWQIVTLRISDGDSVIREIALEKRIR